MKLHSSRPTMLLTLAALLLAGTSGSAAPSSLDQTAAPPATVFLTRHAETDGEGRDPSLSPDGRARAARLAKLLAPESIGRILTTDYRRTRETAAPLAELLGVELEIYDPRALPAVAAALRRDGGKVLVVGHSNTTPALVALLGGEPGEPIAESEHDRLYRVELPSGSTTVERR